jgi:ABC-type multidrug transport system fused ATPase/permease subunit
VLLAAGDTFRAAAIEQLAEWGARHGVTVISQEKGDSAAVIFDAVQSARAKGIDVVIADTAGRLPTQLHLMDEIRKVKRVIAKADPSAPHETLLVIDANTGQNAVRQVEAFDGALGLTGLVVTKLDGTAKGGAVAAIAREHPVPIFFIGIGEKAATCGRSSRRVRRGALRVIQFSAVTKRYPGGHEALRGITAEVAAGEMVAVTGHSGAGKSTLLQARGGHRARHRGTVVVQRPEPRRARRIGARGAAAAHRLRLPGSQAAL